MNVSVSKADLVRELSVVVRAVERKSSIPILSNACLVARGGALTLTGTDLETGLRTSCPAKVKKDGSGTLPAKQLLGYVKLLPEGNVDINFADGWATVKAGCSHGRIAGMGVDNYPTLPAMPAPVCELPAKALAGLIEKTIKAVSREESRFTLSGALFVIEADGYVMVATDGHRLAYAKHKARVSANPARHLIPRKAMVEFVELASTADADTPVSFASDNDHIFLAVAGRVLITRKLTGTFYDYVRILPKKFSVSVTANREALRDALARAQEFIDKRSQVVKLTLANNQLGITASADETCELAESVAVDYTGEPLEIAFNVSYLLDFLNVINAERVCLSLNGAQSPAELSPANDASYRYVVMPIKTWPSQ
jgi:DNA polymerase-3 subunit beta